ncbi:undecaprenyldiphospho-muramoylpentapeptide beta-N-acetylglucosaminyltransferase [Ferrimonas balearica]|uniref:undecaprenyldiphospho-muramoylpentapeptide beta-N-acetylglucosaminyltransferase n=1 Tax=Ferrimonas balearica TaxID=44012 RepID=UPI001C5857B2|nr:undecaprenyldiphospho-muramoylpentapeptide beta-N-acetylglucosaminyltransferase [Ferrimonas balearica]MBW3140374.1 undecaprenyldiphospho-muramoylpentapeptide beta-N-acetylglucosaminyltransferase [Ferrimonas balearica]MBW3165634.1 undecaprenyldiphospho-muramoylpentapeptide beta-N-acetylglucosaminyltransferase [Ferrimonas balearica]MBY6107811.1 undecaprenyldiphospho-muramoylpentapeptide beta-N-acetylglucosaminyltransferase [Ferrimonas balearica]
MSDNKAPRLMVMAGGTGGHVFPALAVARRLRQQGWEVLWLGTAERMEARLVPQHGFAIRFIDIKGVRGNGLLRKLKAPFQIFKAIAQARRIQAEFQPDVVMGMGGYAAGPGGIAAWLRRTPLVLHEQNAVAGATNAILAKFANKVLVAFDNVLPGEQRVGNPVRDELVAIGETQPVVPGEQLKVLVVGGSLGAQVLNDQVPAAVGRLANEAAVTVWHQVGRGNEAAVTQRWTEMAPGVGAQVTEFIDDMAAAYAWADLVICRAGALTVAELAATGRPSLLVPFPHAVDDHQTKNAEALVAAGAARLLPQASLTPERLADEMLTLVQQPDTLVQMAEAARNSAILDATDKVAGICASLARRD